MKYLFAWWFLKLHDKDANGLEYVCLVILMKLNFSWKVYLRKENNPGSLSEGVLLAVGGRYDYLLNQLWSRDHVGYAYTFYCFGLAICTVDMACFFYTIFFSPLFLWQLNMLLEFAIIMYCYILTIIFFVAICLGHKLCYHA